MTVKMYASSAIQISEYNRNIQVLQPIPDLKIFKKWGGRKFEDAWLHGIY